MAAVEEIADRGANLLKPRPVNPADASPMISDTIVAISTPPGRGGIGVVRLSGSSACEIAGKFVQFDGGGWRPWGARLGTLIDETGALVDRVVVTYFAAPKSYTAEDVIEIACHGAPVVLRYAVERALHAGARIANPGEFTLRAYVNGRIDLPQAEAVRDLIDATTLFQAKVAARQTEGSVSLAIAPLKEQLLELISLMEAGIDFAEDDVSVAGTNEIIGRIAPIRAGLAKLEASFAFGKFVHSGATLAIAGRPNVGKSSLFNRMLDQQRAIVTAIAGTTRDTVSEVTSLGCIPIKLVDTAGIREGLDLVERLGIERSRQAMADADLTIIVIDGSCPLTTEDHSLLARTSAQGRRLVVANKCDLPRVADLPGAIWVSAETAEGVELLQQRVIEAIGAGAAQELEYAFITSLRHEQLLHEAVLALDQARAAAQQGIPHEMLMLDFYSALRPIDAITGATTADDILNRIFSTFCIGK